MLDGGMLYAVKLGPIETQQDGLFFLYVGFTEEIALPPAMATQDADGLRQLRDQNPGQELRCEPRLGRAGKKLGFVSAPMPHWALLGRGFISLGIGLGPYGELLDNGTLDLILGATAKFMKAKPWRYWSDSDALAVSVMGDVGQRFEGCIMGSGGQEFGLALYENAGALERIAAAVDADDFAEAAKEPALSLTLNFEPDWAAEAVHEAYGTTGIPIPIKLRGGQPVEMDATSMTLLAAALEAASKLTPKKLQGTAEMPGKMRVTVEAPSPTAGYARRRWPHQDRDHGTSS